MTDTDTKTADPKAPAKTIPQPGVARLVPPADLIDSPFNPRKTYDDAKQAELVESIKEAGVLQALRARPARKGKLELVFGHRRKRGAISAGVDLVMVIVEEMTDCEVRIAQHIENCQREGVHPIEEGDSFADLLEMEGLTVEDIAAKVGCSVSKVRQRLIFTQLCEPGRKACLEGRMRPGVAMLIARIPDKKQQAEATKVFSTSEDDPEGLYNVAQVRRTIVNDYMLRLATAVFDPADEKLVKAVGACTTCPKLVGNQKALFSDIEENETCTDSVCFAKKTKAGHRVTIKKAKKDGIEIIQDPQSIKKLFPYSDRLPHNSEYVDLSSSFWNGGEEIGWSEHLGEHAPSFVIAVTADKAARKLVKKKDVRAALKAAGLHDPLRGGREKAAAKKKAPSTPAEKKAAASEKRAQDKKKKESAIARATDTEVLQQAVAKAEKMKILETKTWLFLLERVLVCCWSDVASSVCKRREITVDEKSMTSYSSSILAYAKAKSKEIQAKDEDARPLILGLIFELTSQGGAKNGAWMPDSWKATLSTLGVDHESIKKKATEDYVQKKKEQDAIAKEKEKAKKARAKAKTKTKKKTAKKKATKKAASK